MSSARSIGDKLLKGTPYRVAVRGPDVVFEIAGKQIVFHPDTAIDIAILFKHCARVAKTKHNMGSVLHGVADLTDAVADERELQKTRDGTATFGVLR